MKSIVGSPAISELKTQPLKTSHSLVNLSLVSALAGLLLVFARPGALMRISAAIACAWITLTFPFAGLILYLLVEYMRPGDVMPSIASWRPALIVAALTMIGLVIAKSKDRSQEIVWSKQSWMLAGFISTMLVSIITAIWKSQALQVTIDAAKIWIVFLIMTNLITTTHRLKQFIWVMVLLGFYLASRSVFMYQRTGDFATGPGEGFLGDRNDLAMAMLVILPIAGSLFQASEKTLEKTIAGATFVALIAGIISTFSRGGFVGLLCVLLGMSLLAKRRTIAFLTLSALLVIAWYVSPDSYKERIISISHYQQDESAQNRLYAWKAARAMFHDRPFFGVGPGNFETAYGRIYRPPGAPGIWRAPHSIYFECIAELGIVGCIFFGLLVSLTYLDCLKIYLSRTVAPPTNWERRMAAGFMLGMTGYLASATFLSALLYSHPYYLAALTVSMANIINSRQPKTGGESV